MNLSKKLFALVLSLSLLAALPACDGSPSAVSPSASASTEPSSDAVTIKLSGGSATIDSSPVEEFDYTWHCDPSIAHDEVKDAPAEFYTSTKPETDAAAYIDHELYYFPELPTDGFRLVNYDGEREWAYYYTDGENSDYIFATLPNLGNSLPAQMMRSEEEAAANKVLHITKPGVYSLEGEWHGQVRVDLGDNDETFTDESAKVTLILNGVDIYRMLRTKYKDDDSTDEIKVQKKMRKVDGINTNEDGVSVTSFVGGSVEINAALGAESGGMGGIGGGSPPAQP